jgi:PTH1 family peptidyl-tRNA hydrolase
MFLLVGLGNVGNKYLLTRHNYGFLVLDKIIQQYNLQSNNIKFKADFFSGNILTHKIIAIKPQNYMNLSGEAVVATANFYKIKPENVLVFHDDLDLCLGKIKYKNGGGSAGHNGLKSIDQLFANNYFRLRLGIGKPEKPQDVASFVLSNFNSQELILINDLTQKIAVNLGFLLNNQVDKFFNTISNF